LLIDFLKDVVLEGTGVEVQIEGINIAGKTGTAQKPKIGEKGYEVGNYIASFVGFFPAEDPQIVGLIILDSPRGLHYGSQTAAPAFKRVTQKIIPSQDIMLKSRIETQEPSFAVASKQEMLDEVKPAEKSNSIFDSFTPESSVKSSELNVKKIDKASDSKKVMPKVIGLTSREAIKLLSSYSIPFKIEGSGSVKKQIPLPGEVLPQGGTCFLECSTND
jgi:membrane carboxypeptidase/penicillin-binding protein